MTSLSCDCHVTLKSRGHTSESRFIELDEEFECCTALQAVFYSQIIHVESRAIVFLAHLSRRLIGELIVYPWSGVRRPSSVHNAQTSSSQKPLGRSKPNFMWSLLG